LNYGNVRIKRVLAIEASVMKIRPYERSTLWRTSFAKRSDDPDERDRESLAEAYRQLRTRAGDLVGEIHAQLPNLTVHDLDAVMGPALNERLMWLSPDR
jgi:hypothetical protein